MLSGVFLLLGLSLTIMDSALGQSECGGPLSTTPFDSIEDLLNYYCRCTYPFDKLNANCVLSSCPSLNATCPLTSGDALTNTASLLNACIRQNSLICGINITSIPMVQLGFTTTQLVPGTVAKGTIWAIPGQAYLNNLSNAKFSVSNVNGSVILAIRAPDVVNQVSHNCTFSVVNTFFVNPLLGMMPSLHTPDLIGTLNLNLSAIVSLDLSTQPPTIDILTDQSNVSIEFTNFVGQLGVKLPEQIVTTFNQVLNTFIVASAIPNTTTNFLSTFAAVALRAAQMNCS